MRFQMHSGSWARAFESIIEGWVERGKGSLFSIFTHTSSVALPSVALVSCLAQLKGTRMGDKRPWKMKPPS